MELFCENSQRLLAVNYFHKKALSKIFHRVLNALANTLPVFSYPLSLCSSCRLNIEREERYVVLEFDGFNDKLQVRKIT